LRQQVLEQEATVSGLRLKERDAATEVGRYEALVAQLELDLDRLERGDVAAQILTPFEFVICPRCGQHLSRVVADGDCLLCLQSEPGFRNEAAMVAEHARITAQLAETVALLQDAESARARAADEVAVALSRLNDLHHELDAQLEGFVSREYAEIEDATRSLAELTARQGAVSSLIAMHDRYHRESEAIPRLEAELVRVAGEVAESRAALGAARQKIQRLSEMFDELLRAFRYPWYPPDGAWIDPDAYLPVVGPDTFAETSSGMQTLLNVAYHLAALRFGLQEDDSLVPLFLVLDSPRKNIGTINDHGIGQQIYGRFRVLQDSYPDRFQMIVADNDPPPFAPDFASVTLTYERPFIPWVEHPGEGRVEPIEV
jgi:hypothetical protein